MDGELEYPLVLQHWEAQSGRRVKGSDPHRIVFDGDRLFTIEREEEDSMGTKRWARVVTFASSAGLPGRVESELDGYDYTPSDEMVGGVPDESIWVSSPWVVRFGRIMCSALKFALEHGYDPQTEYDERHGR